MDLTSIIKILKDNPNLMKTFLPPIQSLAEEALSEIVVTINDGIVQLFDRISKQVNDGIKQVFDTISEEIKKE